MAALIGAVAENSHSSHMNTGSGGVRVTSHLLIQTVFTRHVVISFRWARSCRVHPSREWLVEFPGAARGCKIASVVRSKAPRACPGSVAGVSSSGRNDPRDDFVESAQLERGP